MPRRASFKRRRSESEWRNAAAHDARRRADTFGPPILLRLEPYRDEDGQRGEEISSRKRKTSRNKRGETKWIKARSSSSSRDGDRGEKASFAVGSGKGSDKVTSKKRNKGRICERQ